MRGPSSAWPSASRLRAALIVAGLASSAALGGCRSKTVAPSGGAASAGAPASGAAPLETFVVELEVPTPAGKAGPVPPEAALAPYRVWVNQETPRQKKNPEWHVFAAKDGALLDMAADGAWRCLVNPAQLMGKIGEEGTIERWTASRTLRCSSDAWKTYTESLVTVVYGEGGKREETSPRVATYLKDVVNGQPRSTVVVLDGEVPPPAPYRAR